MCVCVCACVGVCFCEEERVEFGKGKREEEGREGGKKKKKKDSVKTPPLLGHLGNIPGLHPREFSSVSFTVRFPKLRVSPSGIQLSFLWSGFWVYRNFRPDRYTISYYL